MSKKAQAHEKTGKTEMAESDLLTATAAQIAAIFEVSTRTVRLWAQSREMPKSAHGRYNVRDVLTWWLENVYGGTEDTAIEDLRAAKEKYWSAKAERERLKADQERGELVPRSQIVPAWAYRAAECATGMSYLESRLPGLTEGKSLAEARRIIRKETHALREKYFRDGRFCDIRIAEKVLEIMEREGFFDEIAAYAADPEAYLKAREEPDEQAEKPEEPKKAQERPRKSQPKENQTKGTTK